MKYFILLIICCFLPSIHYGQDVLLLKKSGKVVIGDTTIISTPGNYNLYVQNGMMTEKVKVAVKSAADWSDHAFENTPTLDQVALSIKNDSHLFNMPSAEILVREGYELQAMDARMVEQIEWLWQYTLKLSEENIAIKKELEELRLLIEDKKKQ